MARNELQGRYNWQTESGSGGKAGVAEQNLYEVFRKAFVGTDYRISDHPTDLKHLYESVQLSEETLSQIFNPDDVTMKRAQSRGWVEGKKPSAGRGNAHERMCKLFTPGLMKAYREIGKITSSEILPFWVVLEGDITRDPKRNREIVFWFDKYNKNFFMWRPGMSGGELVQHFNKYLKPYLE